MRKMKMYLDLFACSLWDAVESSASHLWAFPNGILFGFLLIHNNWINKILRNVILSWNFFDYVLYHQFSLVLRKFGHNFRPLRDCFWYFLASNMYFFLSFSPFTMTADLFLFLREYKTHLSHVGSHLTDLGPVNLECSFSMIVSLTWFKWGENVNKFHTWLSWLSLTALFVGNQWLKRTKPTDKVHSHDRRSLEGGNRVLTRNAQSWRHSLHSGLVLHS